MKLCPLGCGKHVAFHALFIHVTSQCTKRVVECMLGCGESVPANMLDEHTNVCDRRRISCGCDAPSCARQLRSWLAAAGPALLGAGADVPKPVPTLMPCDAHRSTPLIWAAGRPRSAEKMLVECLLELTLDTSARGHAEHKFEGELPVNHQDALGHTALTRACEAGNKDVVEALIKYVESRAAAAAAAAAELLLLLRRRSPTGPAATTAPPPVYYNTTLVPNKNSLTSLLPLGTAPVSTSKRGAGEPRSSRRARPGTSSWPSSSFREVCAAAAAAVAAATTATPLP